MQRTRAVSAALSLVLSWVMVPAPAVEAQSAYDIVADLNRRAMDAYNRLDIDAAGSMLEEALRVAYQGGVSGPLLAQTNMNMGVVYVGGLSDQNGGLQYFVQAVCADPSIQPDPLTSTPEIQSVFQGAQQQAMAGACPVRGGAPGMASGPGMGPGPMQPMPPPPDEVIIHQSPPEQLSQTPLPLYVEVNPLARPKKVYLFYKALGMEKFKRVPMYRYQSGFAYQISCNDVWEPRVSYYVEVEGEDGQVVGMAASAAQPIEVPVVAQRSQGEAALPGAEPPRTCGASECPPGLKGCVKPGSGAIAEACDEDKDCQSGLECRDDVCLIVGAGSEEIPESFYRMGEPGYEDELAAEREADPSQFRRVFLQLGLAFGGSHVSSGMPADRPAPTDRVYVGDDGEFLPEDAFNPDADPRETAAIRAYFPDGGGDDSAEVVPDPADPTKFKINSPPKQDDRLTAWEPDADSRDSYGQLEGGCAADGQVTGPLSQDEAAEGFIQAIDSNGEPRAIYPSKYCVRVTGAGFVPGVALRGGVGYFVTPEIGLAAIMRLQFSSGEGSLAGLLFGVRGEYMLTPPRGTGLMVSPFVGLTLGQIQAQPSAEGSTAGAPFVKSGMMGGHVGVNIRYRFSRSFGLYAAPEVDVQFPTVLLHVDLLSVGIEAAF
jgi:hypothetical protein